MDNKSPIDISKDSNYVSIFDLPLEHQIIASLCNFYQYKTANANDSPLSLKIDILLDDFQKDILYERMLKSVGINDNDILFNVILRNKIEDIRTMELSDTTLKCNRIKGFFHQTNQKCSQHKVDALFKHVRNSFAHGRIAYENNFVILEDKTKELTGRLVITIDALFKWKEVVEQYLLEI